MPSPIAQARKKRTVQPSLGSPASMNFRRNRAADATPGTGTKPLPEPMSIQHVLLLMVVHLCRKILFVEEYVKIGVYIGSLFIGSLIAEFAPLPRTYFARKDNMFNVYFVKYSMAWTFLILVSFLYMTSRVYTCRNSGMIKRHLIRIGVAIAMWYFWTALFVKVENHYGFCSKSTKVADKYHCTSLGHKWYAFSISGHAFVLVYFSLLIKEEAKALVGWDGIKDMIRYEEHNRSQTPDAEKEVTQLNKLSDEELASLKDDYELFTPYIRGVFIGMTVLSVLWDVMLIATILYFHTMLEKVLGGVIAVLMWYVTYKVWYKKKAIISPGLAGEGPVNYMNPVDPLQSAKVKRRSSLRMPEKKDKDKQPTFICMPLYSLRNESRPNGNVQEDNTPKQQSKGALEI